MRTSMRRFLNLALPCILLLALANGAYGATKSYEFNIVEKKVTRLCKTKSIIVVNDQFPGPQIDVFEGDHLLINVKNHVNHNITLHWHGIFQNRTGWFDGPSSVTQCPFPQGTSYLYNFTVTGQRGTLWWHAHITWMRATVYGALIIHPRNIPRLPVFPFLRPKEEAPIENVLMLGEWWNSDVLAVIDQAISTGGGSNQSDALTINGLPGPLYGKCSSRDTYVVTVKPSKKYLLRIINVAMNMELFFGIANHPMTVVEVDASYVKPFTTDTIVISPGQTTTVLVSTNQPVGSYYMATRAFQSAPPFIPFDNTTGAAILKYEGSSSSSPKLPSLPGFFNSSAVDAFDDSLRSAKSVRKQFPVPVTINKRMFITVGLNLQDCPKGAPNSTCQGSPAGGRIHASMNNISYTAPSDAFLLQHYNKMHFNTPLKGFTLDFPQKPAAFDFTSSPPLANQNAVIGTKGSVIPYGSAVEIVLQGTSILFPESHPIHLHGHDFYVVAKGLGNYNGENVVLNLKDPPARNTIGVPSGGWVVIRFIADNPGTWIMHCHLDLHSTLGLVTLFIVPDGEGPLQSLDPPPQDLPKC